MPLTIPAAIRQLNRHTQDQWGPQGPQYSYRIQRRRGQPPTYYIHRTQDAGPWLPATILWARGPRDHCLAKLRSALSTSISQPI